MGGKSYFETWPFINSPGSKPAASSESCTGALYQWRCLEMIRLPRGSRALRVCDSYERACNSAVVRACLRARLPILDAKLGSDVGGTSVGGGGLRGAVEDPT